MSDARTSSGSEAGELERVDAVVVNWNGSEHLRPCLAGLAAQGARLATTWIVDNASTDGSLALARELDPAARTLELALNRGPSPARNAGLSAASTPWVLLLDNDAVLQPGALERLCAAARAHPSAVIVQPRSVFDSEPTRVHYDGGELHYLGLFSLRNFFTPLADARGSGTLEVGGAVSVALLVRREALLALGGFDERFFILFEDLDLSLRARMAGHAIVSVADALVRHRGGTGGLSYRGLGGYPRSRAFLHSRNRWLVVLKDYRWRTLVLALPALVAFEVVWAVFALATGTFGGWFAGKLDLVRRAPACLRARRAVAALRRVPDRELLVGGPLTIAPSLVRSGVARAALAVLDRGLLAWWWLVRPLCG